MSVNMDVRVYVCMLVSKVIYVSMFLCGHLYTICMYVLMSVCVCVCIYSWFLYVCKLV